MASKVEFRLFWILLREWFEQITNYNQMNYRAIEFIDRFVPFVANTQYQIPALKTVHSLPSPMIRTCSEFSINLCTARTTANGCRFTFFLRLFSLIRAHHSLFAIVLLCEHRPCAGIHIDTVSQAMTPFPWKWGVEEIEKRATKARSNHID